MDHELYLIYLDNLKHLVQRMLGGARVAEGLAFLLHLHRHHTSSDLLFLVYLH